MILQPRLIYHIYNRGNNRQRIFFIKENYSYFLRKMRKAFAGKCDILAYCLMPNHFHILVYVPDHFDASSFYIAYRILLSSYTRAINIQEKRVGSLFQQNSKFKLVADGIALDYAGICFHYIHANPVKSNLVKSAHEWQFSSLQEYTTAYVDTPICNHQLTHQMIDLPKDGALLLQLTMQNVDNAQLDTIL